MKANTKKLLAMGLSVVLAVGCLTGCGGDSKSSSTSGDTAKTGDEGGSSSSKKTFDDLGGMSIKIGDWYTSEDAGETDYAKATENYRKEIMDKYNFKINRESAYSYTDQQETYVNGVMSNSPSCQLFYLYQEMVSAPLMKGLMYDLKTLPEFDFTEEKWNQTVVELMSIGNGIWGMSPENEPRGGVFFNKRMLKEAGISDEEPYDLQRDGKWTWSKFEEIGKDIHEKTGKYLLTSEATGGDTLMMMIQSCGANFVNEDGEAYIVGNETAEKCIDLYTELVQNDVVKLVNNWDEYIATITSGEAAGIVNGNWITATLMSTEDQKGLWGITTMPKVDGVDTATNYANNGGSSWYITSNCKNVELAEDFLASTFGSSTDFYDAILSETGAISCYLPAGESDVYNEPNEFFGGQPIFSTIVEYSSHIPEFTKTPYHYEARECVNTAVVNIVNGTAKEDALQEAQDTLAFKMTE